MPLLIDLILSGNEQLCPTKETLQNPEWYAIWLKWKDSALRHLRQAEIFRIDNVAAYFLRDCVNHPGERWNDYSAFPNIAPPFDVYWMEHKRSDKLIKLPNAGESWFLQGTMIVGLRTENGFKVNASVFCKDDKMTDSTVMAVPGALECELDKDGASINWQVFGSELLAFLAVPSLLATCFLHCKNVIIETAAPEPKLSKKFKKKTGFPLVIHKHLVIDPLREILDRDSTEVGLKQRLHINRGHFKDYTRGAGLGKHHIKGIWWWSSHLSGSVHEGISYHDYDVLSPTPSSPETQGR